MLSFSLGDVIGVLQQRGDWWLGQLNGTQGWFPKSYVALETGGNTEYEDTQECTRLSELLSAHTQLTVCCSHSSVDGFDTSDTVQLEGNNGLFEEKN